MATKKIHQGPVIELSSGAKLKLARVLKASPTSEQKKSLQQSKGIYSLYKERWQIK